MEAPPAKFLDVVVLAALFGERLEGGGDEGALGGGVAPELDLVESSDVPLEAGEDGVHPRVGDWALLDREEVASTTVDEAGIAELPSRGEAHVIAVAPGILSTDYGIHGGVVKATDASELLTHDALLCGELGGVVEVLELAAATLAEERALRVDTAAGGLDDLRDYAFDVVTVDAFDLNLDKLTGGGEGGHEGFAIGEAGETATTSDQPLDANGLEALLLGDLLPAVATTSHPASVAAGRGWSERR